MCPCVPGRGRACVCVMVCVMVGDVEKQRNMKVSFLMDRDKPGVTKSQVCL